jgi:hypothetical protein
LGISFNAAMDMRLSDVTIPMAQSAVTALEHVGFVE